MPQNGLFPGLDTNNDRSSRTYTMTLLKKTLAAALALGLALGGPMATSIFMPQALAEQPAALELTPEQVEVVERINAYFNSFTTLRGEFVQTSPKGRVDRGLLFISKPGKLRFDYAPPSVLLIASDGKWLTIKDKKRERGDQFPLNATPLRYFVAKKIDLMSDALITGFQQENGVATLALADKKGSIRGQLLLVFDETRGELSQWVSIDARGQRLTVDVLNLEKDVALDPELFQVTINRQQRLK
jgi:outer membrane lipoprotein-sorting protein